MTTETTETVVADTADLTFTADFLTLGTFSFGPQVAVHLSDQTGHLWVTEWSRPELSPGSPTASALSAGCPATARRTGSSPIASTFPPPARSPSPTSPSRA